MAPNIVILLQYDQNTNDFYDTNASFIQTISFILTISCYITVLSNNSWFVTWQFVICSKNKLFLLFKHRNIYRYISRNLARQACAELFVYKAQSAKFAVSSIFAATLLLPTLIESITRLCISPSVQLTDFYCTTNIEILLNYDMVISPQARPYAQFDRFCPHTNYLLDWPVHPLQLDYDKAIFPATIWSKNHLKDLHCSASLKSFLSDKSPTFPNLSSRLCQIDPNDHKINIWIHPSTHQRHELSYDWFLFHRFCMETKS